VFVKSVVKNGLICLTDVARINETAYYDNKFDSRSDLTIHDILKLPKPQS
jgi:hypothetical protein